MAAAQTLLTNIVINAKTGNGFGAVGATLTEMGAMVDGISQKLISFGEDSVNVYREYEKSMRDSEVALSTTYGRGSKELSGVMDQLDSAATKWAATSIFHTNDVANAISEASHAGWDLDQIMSGIPAAMTLAQAGSMDLSNAVNYIVKSTNAAGVEFEDITKFADEWTFAANSSASTVSEFGDAMLQMGASMKFAESPEELMTLIATMANSGTVGSQAGTMIRSSLMRLIAPTQKAQKAMAELGATSDEASAILNDEALAAANAELAAHGFSLYDSDGNMKGILDTYRELYVALGEIAGGYDKIGQNEDAMRILGAIFPTRTITAALTMLQGVEDQYDGLYTKLKDGSAEGYAQYAADTMMDSLDGRIETFESKVERLQQLTGGILSSQLSGVLESGGNFVDMLSDLPEGKLKTIISGAETIAGMGPGLIAVGGAFRFIGRMLTPTGAFVTALTAAATFASVMNNLDREKFEDAFGTMDLDDQAILQYAESLSAGYDAAHKTIDDFRKAVSDSLSTYETASSTLSSDLLTAMLTNTTLSEPEQERLFGLGDQMQKAVLEGIENSTDAKLNYWSLFFGGDEKAQDNDTFGNIANMTMSGYDQAVAEAEAAGKNLRKAMTKAFEDGKISEEEYGNILNIYNDLNEKMAQAAAEAQDRQSAVEREKLLHKMQTASLDEIEGLTKEISDLQNDEVKRKQDEYADERAGVVVDYDNAIANAESAQEKDRLSREKDQVLKDTDSRHEDEINRTYAQYDQLYGKLYDSQIEQSEFAELYGDLNKYAEAMTKGTMQLDSAYQAITDQYGGGNSLAGERSFFWDDKTREHLLELTAQEISQRGGYESLVDRAKYYEDNGDAADAAEIKNLLARAMILSDGNLVTGGQAEGWYGALLEWFTGDKHAYESLPGNPGQEKVQSAITGETPEDYTPEAAKDIIASWPNGESVKTFFDTFQKASEGKEPLGNVSDAEMQIDRGTNRQLWDLAEKLETVYDFNKINADTATTDASKQAAIQFPTESAMYQLLYGSLANNAEEYRRADVSAEVSQNTQSAADTTVTPSIDTTASVSELEEAVNAITLKPNVSGDMTEIDGLLDAIDAMTLVPSVSGDPTGLEGIYNSYNGRTITWNIATIGGAPSGSPAKFATGGRATEASIFGEAGPEWAIPEQHSERTADLLNAAREASGFTWSDLLTRYGGLNASANNNTPSTLVYSPTVHANDASGVEQVLQNDKEQFERWYKERKMRDDVEVYA